MVLTLRMFTEAELDHFDAPSAAETSYNWFGFRSTAGVRRDFAVDGLVGAGGGTLAIDLDGTVIGDLSWVPRPYGPPPVPPALSIGVQLRSPYRGQGYGTEAQRQLAAYLFSVHPVHRIEASTDVTNVAEQRALTKAGFRREGVLRGAQFRDGRYRDLVQFGRLRDDDPERGDDRDPDGDR